MNKELDESILKENDCSHCSKCLKCNKNKQKTIILLEEIKKTREYKYIKKYYKPDSNKSIKVKSLHNHYLKVYKKKKDLLSRMQFKRALETFLPPEILSKNKNRYSLEYHILF